MIITIVLVGFGSDKPRAVLECCMNKLEKEPVWHTRARRGVKHEVIFFCLCQGTRLCLSALSHVPTASLPTRRLLDCLLECVTSHNCMAATSQSTLPSRPYSHSLSDWHLCATLLSSNNSIHCATCLRADMKKSESMQVPRT